MFLVVQQFARITSASMLLRSCNYKSKRQRGHVQYVQSPRVSNLYKLTSELNIACLC